MAGSSPAGRVMIDVEGMLKGCLRYGGRSSVGRAPDCDSGCRGFEPHRSPIIAGRIVATWVCARELVQRKYFGFMAERVV